MKVLVEFYYVKYKGYLRAVSGAIEHGTGLVAPSKYSSSLGRGMCLGYLLQ